MGCIALFRCVLVLRCGSAGGGVVYLYSTIKHDGISHTGFVRVRTGKSVTLIVE